MYTHKKLREHISALADGALPDAELELALAALQEPDGRRAWEIYHRIGDALRAEGDPGPSAQFAATLAARLAAEPAPAQPELPVCHPRGGGGLW
ncbi:MAG TPA: RseA family anti-sigma factor [Telluria sp.]|nr:RseA family anti-sigma factor [Telluria sp.]